VRIDPSQPSPTFLTWIVACGRDYAVRIATGNQEHSVAEDGFAGITVQVLCDRPHVSTVKAAAIVGIGRSNVIDIGSPEGKGIDLDILETRISEYAASFERDRKVAFVVLSFGEVNTVGERFHFGQASWLTWVRRESSVPTLQKYAKYAINIMSGCISTLVPISE
jgi:hypothetical protein